jgi:hypothetical protein
MTSSSAQECATQTAAAHQSRGERRRLWTRFTGDASHQQLGNSVGVSKRASCRGPPWPPLQPPSQPAVPCPHRFASCCIRGSVSSECEWVQRAYDTGHEIATHTVSHSRE